MAFGASLVWRNRRAKVQTILRLENQQTILRQENQKKNAMAGPLAGSDRQPPFLAVRKQMIKNNAPLPETATNGDGTNPQDTPAPHFND